MKQFHIAKYKKQMTITTITNVRIYDSGFQTVKITNISRKPAAFILHGQMTIH